MTKNLITAPHPQEVTVDQAYEEYMALDLNTVIGRQKSYAVQVQIKRLESFEDAEAS